IGNEQLGKAVDEQAIVKTELNKLLELLMSEQGPKRLADEKERIKKYLQDVIRLIKDQTEIDDNITHGNPGQLAGRQDKVAERTKKVGDEIARNEGLGKTGDKKSGDGKSSDGKSGDGKSGDGKSGDGKSKSGDGKSGDGKPGKSKGGAGGESDPRKEPPEGGAGGDSEGNQPPQDKLERTKKRIYEAEKRMREAKQRL